MERASAENVVLSARGAIAVLLKLAEKCERADGPSRELDKAINNLINPPRVAAADEDQPPPGFGSGFLSGAYWGAEYTGSIDAAMTLVPEGYDFEMAQSGPLCGAVVWPHGADKMNSNVAASLALALCAASLRALASKDQR